MEQDYQARTLHKAALLEKAEAKARTDAESTKQHLARILADIELELDMLRSELRLLDQETQEAAERVRATLLQFKNVIRKNDMNRLQQRIDMWKPEARVTRKQFSGML